LSDWEEFFKNLPKPRLSHFFTKSTDDNILPWIKCSDKARRSLAFLWLSDIVTIEIEIRRAVSKAKAAKGLKVKDAPEAEHALFRYHADNACYRIFASLDKSGQLLNAYFDLKVERPTFSKVTERIANFPALSNIEHLRPFLEIVDSKWYKALSDYRHSLSHRLNPVGDNQISLLGLVKGLAQYLEFSPVTYSLDELDNLITEGHGRIAAIVEAFETLLNTTQCGNSIGQTQTSKPSTS
jgi:hypothetical protein